tara:strand:- start:4260 stop:5180 length:921 start_codon:yes stop_codon:yes gene_type:complete
LKILIFGSKGMVGSSLVNILSKYDSYQVVPSSREDTDLFELNQTKYFIEKTNPDIIINAAAMVGGIYANNTQRSKFIINNLKINMNILESSIAFPNIKIINLGSSCIYPLDAKNPIKEASIMTGKLEPTNSPYAMAKLSAIEIGDAISKEFGHEIVNLMPTNLYGPNDHFSDNDSHVIPGLIHRMHKAKVNNEKSFAIWGSGKPLREFLYVDDLSFAIKKIIETNPKQNLINVGSGSEISIKDLASLIKEITSYKGELIFDTNKPDGNPRKLLDSEIINSLDWSPKYSLREGLELTYDWYLKAIKF